MTASTADTAKAASDARLAAVFTAPDEARRREAAADLRDSDWQRIADVTLDYHQLEAAAEAD